MRHSLFTLICLLFIHGATAQAGNDAFFTSGNNALSTNDSFLPVGQAYVLDANFNSAGQLQLHWQIAEGYYLYRHAFAVKLNDGRREISLTPQIEPGLKKHDEYFGDVEVYYHYANITLDTIPQQDGLQLTVTSQGCADAGLCYPPRKQYLELNSIQGIATEIDRASIRSAQPAPEATSQSHLLMLLFAMLGGMILNLMPCVFPVLSLKVLSFTQDRDHSHSVHGVVYTLGVVVSFVIVAAILLSLRSAGEAIGWGFHLQSPWFVAALAYLFFTMGLSLSGVVELGSRWMNIGNTLSSQSGYSGSFFTGVLATVVASPCTAPFMGSALGFAATQPPFTAITVFAALGFGMALPMLILSCSPALLKYIPKPGRWMDSFKQLLAFPLYATAIWLCWVLGRQVGANGMAMVLSGCLLITLAIWLWRGRLLSRVISVISIALALSLITGPALTPQHNGEPANTDDWTQYSPARLAELRQQGKPVFLNITADWCITCLANEKVTLNTDKVRQAFAEYGITYMKGDWTRYDPEITQLLSEYGRNGIPLYLAFPSDPSQPAHILPQLLTTDTVINAVQSL